MAWELVTVDRITRAPPSSASAAGTSCAVDVVMGAEPVHQRPFARARDGDRAAAHPGRESLRPRAAGSSDRDRRRLASPRLRRLAITTGVAVRSVRF
jgi:hypothetical protein